MIVVVLLLLLLLYSSVSMLTNVFMTAALTNTTTLPTRMKRKGSHFRPFHCLFVVAANVVVVIATAAVANRYVCICCCRCCCCCLSLHFRFHRLLDHPRGRRGLVFGLSLDSAWPKVQRLFRVPLHTIKRLSLSFFFFSLLLLHCLSSRLQNADYDQFCGPNFVPCHRNQILCGIRLFLLGLTVLPNQRIHSCMRPVRLFPKFWVESEPTWWFSDILDVTL